MTMRLRYFCWDFLGLTAYLHFSWSLLKGLDPCRVALNPWKAALDSWKAAMNPWYAALNPWRAALNTW